MLKFLFLFIAGSVFVWSMSVETIFTVVFSSINYINIDTTEVLAGLMALQDLQTGIPANGYQFTNLTDLIHIIERANFIYELGYIQVNGVLVYAIQIGNTIYSVEPNIFHSLIYSISYFIL